MRGQRGEKCRGVTQAPQQSMTKQGSRQAGAASPSLPSAAKPFNSTRQYWVEIIKTHYGGGTLLFSGTAVIFNTVKMAVLLPGFNFTSIESKICCLVLWFLLDGPLVEQLDVSVLHILLVFAQSSLSLLLTGEQRLGITGWSAVRKVGDHHLLAVCHGAEPLQILNYWYW